MKRTMLFGIAMALFSAPAQPLLAQSWQVGFSAAPTYTNVTGDFVARSDWAWGLLIGGQIGPRLQGRISQRAMELGIGILFLVLAVAMMIVALMKFGVL